MKNGFTAEFCSVPIKESDGVGIAGILRRNGHAAGYAFEIIIPTRESIAFVRGGFGSSGGVSVFNNLLGERAAGKPVNECYEITVDGIFGGNGDIVGDEFAVVIISNEGVAVVNRCFGKNGVLAFVYACGAYDVSGESVNKCDGVGVDILINSVFEEPYGGVGTVRTFENIETCTEAGSRYAEREVIVAVGTCIVMAESAVVVPIPNHIGFGAKAEPCITL